MVVAWNASGDFQAVVDTLETVTIVRPGDPAESASLAAWRYEETTSTPWDGGDAVVETQTTWQVPHGIDQAAPKVTERIMDASGRTWVIEQVERLRGSTRYLCEARETVLRRDRSEVFRVERSIWQEGSEAPELVGWAREEAILGTKRLLSSDYGLSGSEVRRRYQIGLVGDIEIGLGHRIIGQQGEILAVMVPSSRPSAGSLLVLEAEQLVDLSE